MPERMPESTIMDPGWRGTVPADALARARAPIAAILKSALNGGELGFEEGVALGAVAEEDLVALVKTADGCASTKSAMSSPMWSIAI